MYYKCRHFNIKELVDKKTFARFGEDAWMFFNPMALRMLDALRDYFATTVTVNDWPFGGKNQYRGFRPPGCKIGAEFSQHKRGAAFDISVKGFTAETVREEILTHKDTYFPQITCLEGEIPWVHFDCRNIPDRIRIVYP
ncbi:MAG: hypothetical protein AVO39_10370 [delta proteobacterium MLS_D]|jgi:hypothetical protein|nr:MAG: hypothetical protein AVO39_10370 [delta proteobacterium MLS_D]